MADRQEFGSSRADASQGDDPVVFLERERIVLQLHDEGLSVQEIGDTVGVATQRVMQVLKVALEKRERRSGAPPDATT